MTIHALLGAAAGASLLLACGSSAPPETPGGARQSNGTLGETTTGGGDTPAAEPAEQAQCPESRAPVHDGVKGAAVIAAWEKTFADAEAVLDGCDESCRMTSNGNGATQLTMNSLMELAVAGYLPAQSRYGRELFTTLMTTGEEPELEASYVTAIEFLRLAALRGDAAVSDLIPGLAEVELTNEGDFLPSMPAAFRSLEASWVVAGFRQAESVKHCYPSSSEAPPLP